MNLISASSLHRVDACPASAVLPRSTHDSIAADRGNWIHAFMADLAKGLSRDEALTPLPDAYKAICAELPDPGRGIVEVAFAYNIANGECREIGRDVERAYGKLAPSEIPGSADLVQMAGDVVDITDYKTGHSEVPPARDNLQLHFLALCATRVYGASKARVTLVHIRDDGSVWRDSHELDAFDLASIAERLEKLWTRVQIAKRAVGQGKQPDTREGAHCQFCPSKTACPAKVAWLVRLGAPQGIEQRFDALLTGATARQAYEVYLRAEEVLGAIRGKLYAFARENPFDVGDGKVFGPTTFERESVDGGIVYAVLASLYGHDVAAKACEYTSSKAAIERALKDIAPRGSLAAFKRKALDEIAARGGIEVKVTETIKEHTRETNDAAKIVA